MKKVYTSLSILFLVFGFAFLAAPKSSEASFGPAFGLVGFLVGGGYPYYGGNYVTNYYNPYYDGYNDSYAYGTIYPRAGYYVNSYDNGYVSNSYYQPSYYGYGGYSTYNTNPYYPSGYTNYYGGYYGGYSPVICMTNVPCY